MNDGSTTCGGSAACGGDLTGDWHVSRECAKVTSIQAAQMATGLPAACSGAFETAVDGASVDTSNATLSFSGDGHYTGRGTVRLAFSFTYTDACLAALGAPAASDAVCAQIAVTPTDPNQNPITLTCTFAAPGCLCSFTMTEAFAASGTYVSHGNEASFDGEPDSPYCVRGSAASVSIPRSGGMMELELTR